MIFYSKSVMISTLTTHIPLNKINKFIKHKKLIYQKIYSLNESLKIDFNIKKPKIAIAGINPHAGEDGMIGHEEINLLNPVIKKLKINSVHIDGPFSASTMFNNLNRKKYNCFICIYHDQALIPFKIICPFGGVNFTSSLGIIRTSPDHGTAYDLINTNKANNQSLINSFIIAEKIYTNRLKNEFN